MVSPRLAALVRAMEAADPDALARFWREVETAGAPLVEPDPDDPGRRLVTFVWRDADAATHNVQVLGGPWPPGVADTALVRLADSDLWYRTDRVRSDFRGLYRMLANDPDPGADSASVETILRRFVASTTDPHNPRTHAWPADEESSDPQPPPGSELVLPDAPAAVWYADSGDAAKGTLELLRVQSRELGNTRRVWVYRSPGAARSDRPAAVAVLLDGRVWALCEPIMPTLDRLAAAGTLAPIVVVMVDSLGQETRMRELGRHAPFVAFLADELLPMVADRWPVSREPARTAIAGQSLGGLTAAYAALERPDTFGHAVCQSGSFWWPADVEGRLDADWQPGPPVQGAEITRAALDGTDRRPVAFSLEVGVFEGSVMVWPNRRLRDALVSRGYPVRYREFAGGHEHFSWRGTLAAELAAMLAV